MNVYKYVARILSVLFAVGLGVLVYLNWANTVQLHQALKDARAESAEQAKRFDEALGRAQVRIDTTGKLLDVLSKDLPKNIREDLEAHDARITSILTGRFVNNSTGGGKAPVILSKTETSGPTKISTDSPKVEGQTPACSTGPFTWELSDWRIDGTLVAKCGQEGDFNYKLHQRFDLIEATGSDGSHYIKIYELDKNGKHYGEPLITEQLNVTNERNKIARFYAWAPHIDLALGADLHREFQAEAGLSLMGYGKTENDLTWKFIRVGTSYDSSLGIVGCPASYNLGDPLPLLSNVWLNPCYKYNGNHGASFSIGATL